VWDSNNQWSQVKNFSVLSTPYYGQAKALQFINENTLIGGYTSGYVIYWSIATGLNLSVVNLAQGSGAIMALSRVINTCYMAASIESKIAILRICDYTIEYFFPNYHTKTIIDFELAQNDTILISSSLDNIVLIWSLSSSSSSLLFYLSGHTSYVYGLKMVSSSVLASGSCDNTIILWNILNGGLIQKLLGHTSPILYALDLLDNSTIISGAGDMTLKLWSTNNGSLLQSKGLSCSPVSLAIMTKTGLK
jgi:hypothetical protein